jgi:hypothetical protein
LPGIHGDSLHQVLHICQRNAPNEPRSQSPMAPPAITPAFRAVQIDSWPLKLTW